VKNSFKGAMRSPFWTTILGETHRIADVKDKVRLIQGMSVNPGRSSAAAGMDGVIHLAYVNGTEFSIPSLSLCWKSGSRAW